MELRQNVSTWASNFTSRNHVFGIIFSLKSQDVNIGIVKKQLVFIAYSPHCFAKSKLRKTTKKLHNTMPTPHRLEVA